MIARQLSSKLTEMRSKFPVLFLTGPRQSGKTTLLKHLFPELPYFSLEEPDIRQLALSDPRGFLANLPNGGILDEAQRAPELFSYIQSIVDARPEVFFVLSGSQNFLLSNQISQSLAGRVSVQKLLPLSFLEMKEAGIAVANLDTMLWQGSFPRIFDRHISPVDFYGSYLETYVQRDVRLLKNIGDLDQFIRFMGLCAGRCGQVVNYQSLAADAGTSPATVKSWLSVLQASYVVFLLQPHHVNFNKQLTKSPKLYFHDTGLVCSLLGIRQPEMLTNHFIKGHLFENFVILELQKLHWNRGAAMQAWFWQDKLGKEIDLLVQSGLDLLAIEVKSGQTFNPSFFQNLVFWQKLSGEKPANCQVVFGGDNNLNTSNGRLLGWRDWPEKGFPVADF